MSAFYSELDPYLCSRKQIAKFTHECIELGVKYIGICCGNNSGYIRAMAEALGRQPNASRYSPDMKMHYSQLNDVRHELTHGTFNTLYKPSQ